MEYLVFRSAKSANRVILPADQAMVIERMENTVVYAIGGSGQDRMVWELPQVASIHICSSMSQALALHIPAPAIPGTQIKQVTKDAAKTETKTEPAKE